VSAALKFDVTAYGENVNETADAKAGCDYTIYGEDNGPLSGKLSPFMTAALGYLSNVQIQVNLAPSEAPQSDHSG